MRADSDEYIFRSLQFNKNLNKNTLNGINKPLSYTRARELLFKALVSIGCDKSMFGLHSLRVEELHKLQITMVLIDFVKLMAFGKHQGRLCTGQFNR